MELQFDKTLFACLQPSQPPVQNQEQTQEVRLPEGMPDIGNVLGCWGQVILRGKEWRGDTSGVSGGVMVWVLYLPEEGGPAQSVEAWLPFQMKWNIEPGQYDGTLLALPLLRSADARCLSARKLMVRVNVSMQAKILQPMEAELYQCGQLPEDVQVLKREYPLIVPAEAGEKAFSLEESFHFSTAEPKVDKLLFYSLKPEITEKKLMTDKVIFRGVGILHVLCRSEDGQLWSRDFDVPFSQYAELDRIHEEDGIVELIPLVTNLELEPGGDGSVQMKAGMSGQYVVYDRPRVELAEDAYSPVRPIKTHMSRLQLPIVLDETSETIHAETVAQADAQKLVDVTFWHEHPYMMTGDAGVEGELGGIFQTLYYDPDGQLQCIQTRWEGDWQLPADPQCNVSAVLQSSGIAQASQDGAGVRLRGDLWMQSRTGSAQGLSMITGLTLGEEQAPDPGRPTLIIRKAGEDTLWDIAKQTGSTVAAIEKANSLQQEPEKDRMLLIPVP